MNAKELKTLPLFGDVLMDAQDGVPPSFAIQTLFTVRSVFVVRLAAN